MDSGALGGVAQAVGEDVAGIYDDDASKHGSELLGVRVLGSIEAAARGVHHAIMAVGNNSTRKRIVEELSGLQWATAVHPRALVHPSVTLGPGTVVFAGAVIQPDTTLGAHVIVNTGATIDHDGILADYVHVAPGAHLAGGVRLGEGVFMGIATSTMPGTSVGAWATVGAGAAVVRDLPGNVTAVGVPARSLSSTSS